MEKIQEINNGNADIKNVYFGFENIFPTNKNNSEIIDKKRNKSKNSKNSKKTKKSKSKNKKEKEKTIEKNINIFNQTKEIKNYDIDSSKYLMKGNKYSKIPVKKIKTDEEKEKEYFEDKKKKEKSAKKKKKKKTKTKTKTKTKSKAKSKTKSKNKIKNNIEDEIDNDIEDEIKDEIEDENSISKEKEKDKSKSKSKTKSKTKNKSKSKEIKKKKNKSKSKSKEKKIKQNNIAQKVKKESKKLSKNTEEQEEEPEPEPEPEFNEIKDEAMNQITKHIHNLSLGFNNNINIINNKTNYKTNNKTKNENIKNLTDKKKSNKNNNVNDKNTINNLLYQDDTILKRPYTAHGYKVKSKSKKLTKTVRNNNINEEEEKIIAFKEKVLVHDKILSLYNNFQIKNINNDNFSKTHKPRVGSAFNLTNKKNNTSKHYMKPREIDIKKIKKKEVIYYNERPEEDLNELKNNKSEKEIKKKNDKAIKLIKSSNKYYDKSKQVLNDLKDVLTKENMDAFMNNFMLKNNFNIKEQEESKMNTHYSPTDKYKIKFYHGGKIFRKPKTYNKIIRNNSDNDLEKKRKIKIFNPKELISNPNNKFNFFSQTFTKQPIYGKYYVPPKIENTINTNLSYIASNKWNGRYKIKKYIYEEKENPNDVYNYDYKYDDLNSDSDNELPSTNFKARTIPKYKNVDIEYKDKKTGKIIGNNKNNKNDTFQDNGALNKNIYHPFLINDDDILKI